MSVDLYAVLGLRRGCSAADVQAAFRRAALRLHPDRARLESPLQFAPQPGCAGPTASSPEEEGGRFALAARAYEVLVDPRTRAAYDLGGAAGLPPFHGDPQRTFRTFFGTDNPFLAQLRDRVHLTAEEPLTPEPVVVPLAVSLQEVNEGAVRTVTAAVRVPAPGGAAGDATKLVERKLTVEVPPGALAGTRYEFPGAGHQAAGAPAGAVVVVLEEVPHPRFSRRGADLVQSETVSLREALTGCTVEVVTLDGRLIRMAITDVVRPGYEKRISGEGLPPPPAAPGAGRGAAVRERGDLVVRLEVRFPASLSRTCRALLDQALQQEEQGGLAAPRADGATGGVARAILEEKMRRQAAV